jgi:hypothetical protein
LAWLYVPSLHFAVASFGASDGRLVTAFFTDPAASLVALPAAFAPLADAALQRGRADAASLRGDRRARIGQLGSGDGMLSLSLFPPVPRRTA